MNEEERLEGRKRKSLSLSADDGCDCLALVKDQADRILLELVRERLPLPRHTAFEPANRYNTAKVRAAPQSAAAGSFP
jgi:hypothetical protein